jgi:hypothetical protein
MNEATDLNKLARRQVHLERLGRFKVKSTAAGCIRDRSSSRRRVAIGSAADRRPGLRTTGYPATRYRKKAGVRSLKLEELEVKRLRVGELVISDSLLTLDWCGPTTGRHQLIENRAASIRDHTFREG